MIGQSKAKGIPGTRNTEEHQFKYTRANKKGRSYRRWTAFQELGPTDIAID